MKSASSILFPRFIQYLTSTEKFQFREFGNPTNVSPLAERGCSKVFCEKPARFCTVNASEKTVSCLKWTMTLGERMPFVICPQLPFWLAKS